MYLQKRPTPSAELQLDPMALKKSQSVANVHKNSHTQDLLGLFSTDINFDTAQATPNTTLDTPNTTAESNEVTGLPGAESTRLDTSDNSHLSREVSDLLSDINNLNNDIHEATDPPELPTSQPPDDNCSDNNNWAWPSNNSFNVSDTGPPTLPTKTRPASVQREKIASSLISLPRPPSRARPDTARLRGTPSPTPASLLPSTNLSIARSDSTGSQSPDNTTIRQRTGPLMPAPVISRSESPPAPSQPPPNPPPMLHQNFSSSRGPSPLTLSSAESVPLAVAFQEVVHAAFRGAEESRCLVRLLGDMMLSFPAGIVSVFAANPYPAPLQFRILNAARLESVLPNKQLISKVKNSCTESVLVFEFNMSNLQELLIKQSQMNPQVISKFYLNSHLIQ